MSATDVKQIYIRRPKPEVPYNNTHSDGNDYQSSGYLTLDESAMVESVQKQQSDSLQHQTQVKTRQQITSATDLKEIYTGLKTSSPSPDRKASESDHYDVLENVALNRPQSELGQYALPVKETNIPSSPDRSQRRGLCLELVIILMAMCAILLSSLVPTLVLVTRMEMKVEAFRDIQNGGSRAVKQQQPQRSPKPAASELRILYNNTCFCLYTEPRNWHQARDFCYRQKSGGAFLAEILHKDTNAFLMPILYALKTKMCWIGGSDIENEGHFKWEESKATVETFHPSQWQNGEPSVFFQGKAENCIDVRDFGSGGFSWNDDHCDTEKPFLCQSPLNAENQCGC